MPGCGAVGYQSVWRYSRGNRVRGRDIFSDRDWDTPPGTGHLTVAVITICGILTVIMTLRAPQKGADEPPSHLAMQQKMDARRS
jgi:hypothetical protein